MSKLLAFDSETTGLSLYHGCKPFFFTICDEQGPPIYWEWLIDPYSRNPIIPEKHGYSDLDEIAEYINSADEIVGHNIKFDVHAVNSVCPYLAENWPWEKTQDTIIAAHILNSASRKDLTSLCRTYLGLYISKLEKSLEREVKEARKTIKENFKDWRLASSGDPSLPSVRDDAWRCDYWTPRAVAHAAKYPKTHPWWTVLSDYANADSETTLALWLEMKKRLENADLWEIYRERMRLIPVLWRMENRGVTVSKKNLDHLMGQYAEEISETNQICRNIAGDFNYNLEMPNGTSNNSLKTFVFDILKFPVVATTKTGNPGFDKHVIEEYVDNKELTPVNSKQRLFFQSIKGKNDRSTALNYMRSYELFGVPNWNSNDLFEEVSEENKYYVLHPNVNPTGTATLRLSCNNPNAQNVSKKEDEDEGIVSVRWTFGPQADREWYAMDAENIELRIPAFLAEEQEMIDIFMNPKKPPYYGSYHLVVFDLLHPEKFKEYGINCKEKFKDTWYQWTKNGSFARLYGGQERKVDATFGVPGADRMIRGRFPKITAFTNKLIDFANENGYIETVVDTEVTNKRGYPIRFPTEEDGSISLTKILNYKCQASASQIVQKAMVRCEDKMLQWKREEGFKSYILMNIHDEIVFDFPRAKTSKELERNREKINQLRKISEGVSMTYSPAIPISYSVKRITSTWAEGEKVES